MRKTESWVKVSSVCVLWQQIRFKVWINSLLMKCPTLQPELWILRLFFYSRKPEKDRQAGGSSYFMCPDHLWKKTDEMKEQSCQDLQRSNIPQSWWHLLWYLLLHHLHWLSDCGISPPLCKPRWDWNAFIYYSGAFPRTSLWRLHRF